MRRSPHKQREEAGLARNMVTVDVKVIFIHGRHFLKKLEIPLRYNISQHFRGEDIVSLFLLYLNNEAIKLFLYTPDQDVTVITGI